MRLKRRVKRSVQPVVRRKWCDVGCCCHQAASIDDNLLSAHTCIGEAFMAKESWEEAVREFRRAKEIDGGNHEANDGLHRAEAALKQSKVKDYYKILGECADNESCVKVVYLLVSVFFVYCRQKFLVTRTIVTLSARTARKHWNGIQTRSQR
jgi:hypothetical protein